MQVASEVTPLWTGIGEITEFPIVFIHKFMVLGTLCSKELAWGFFLLSRVHCLFTKMFGFFFLQPKDALCQKIVHPFHFFVLLDTHP